MYQLYCRKISLYGEGEYLLKLAKLKEKLEKIKNNNGKCYLYINNKNVVGLIMGIIPKYDENDYLDYKCPKKGEVTELIIKKEYRNINIGKILLNKMEEYFRKNNFEYSFIDVFAYNKSGINFYDKNGYHPRMIIDIKKL